MCAHSMFIILHTCCHAWLSQVERIDCGEEVTFDYVESLLRVAVDQWNHCVKLLKGQSSSPEVVLKALENQNSGTMTRKEMQKVIDEVNQKVASLQTISIHSKNNTFRTCQK